MSSRVSSPQTIFYHPQVMYTADHICPDINGYRCHEEPTTIIHTFLFFPPFYFGLWKTTALICCQLDVVDQKLWVDVATLIDCALQLAVGSLLSSLFTQSLVVHSNNNKSTYTVRWQRAAIQALFFRHPAVDLVHIRYIACPTIKAKQYIHCAVYMPYTDFSLLSEKNDLY